MRAIWRMSAVETAQATRSGRLSCTEVVEAHCERLQAVNPDLNAVTVDLRESAVEAARALDAAFRAGVAPGPLHGVPVTIKENVDVTGQATPNGVAGFAGVIAPDDSPVTRNLTRAGAVVIGRTNTPEFSFRAFTDNPLRGLTRNPWDPEGVTCGGSSGGAAASVAAGVGAIAHGNDIGGSLRIPAYCCGCATIRPTLGRVPAYNPSQAEERALLMQMMSVQGPIARARYATYASDSRPWPRPIPATRYGCLPPSKVPGFRLRSGWRWSNAKSIPPFAPPSTGPRTRWPAPAMRWRRPNRRRSSG